MDLREALLAALKGARPPGVVGRFEQGSKALAVVVRSDGDVQVEFYIDEVRGSPFEQLFVVPEGEEENVAEEVCNFVTGVIDEAIVLAVDDRLFRGGRLWVHPDELDGIEHLSFSASWRGTFDRPDGAGGR